MFCEAFNGCFFYLVCSVINHFLVKDFHDLHSRVFPSISGALKYHSVFTHLFEADKKSLFKTNNMTSFRDGLIDLSRKSNGVPLVASMPHFLYGDPALVKLFNTKPSVSAHNTFVSTLLCLIVGGGHFSRFS